MFHSVRYALSVIAFLLLSSASFGQEVKKIARSLSVTMGAVHYRFIDEAFAHERMQYQGTSFAAALSHQRSTGKYVFAVKGGGGSGWTSAYAQWPDARVLQLWLNAGYARRILDHKIMKASSTLYIGGQLASSNWVIENVDEYDEGTINGFNTVNFFIFHKTIISTGSRLEISLSLPVAGLVKRTSYDGGINLDLEEEYDSGEIHVIFGHTALSGVNPLYLPELGIDFIHGIGPNTDFVINYRFNYLKDLTIAPVRLYSNSLLAGFRFNFDRNQ